MALPGPAAVEQMLENIARLHTFLNEFGSYLTVNNVSIPTLPSSLANLLMASANAMPTSGTYKQGFIVWNSACAAGQPIGWMRLTSSNTNVLGVDWKALTNL